MAHSKVRWISTPAFLACLGGMHSRGEGANICEGAQMAEVGAWTIEGGAQMFAPLGQVYAPLN